jgi:Domain of unknown function (DUF5610)
MMALGGIQGSDLSSLLKSMNDGKGVGKGQLSGMDVPRVKPQEADKPEEAGQGRALGHGSARVQVEAMQTRMLFAATIRVSNRVGGLFGGGEKGLDFAAQMAGIMAGHAEAFQADETGMRPIDKLAAEFTPEKTAGRIADFALSWYGQWLDGREDSTESRAEFAEYIGDAVQQGFDEAAGILGALPENTQAGIDQTHKLVFGALEDFVENGQSKDPQQLAGSQVAGLQFNATFGFYNDPMAMMDDLLDRLNNDGSLNLVDVAVPHSPGFLVDVEA